MKKFKKVEKTFWFSIISFSVMSLCILFMPMASNLSELTNKRSLVIVGSVFWLSGITGVVFMLFVRKERKNYFRKMNKENQNNDKSTKNAIASCLQAKVAGCVAILSFLIFIISLFTNLKYGYISFVVLFILVFSLCMYFIFNGKNYRFIKRIKGEM
ncbi:MAG: hypothetical protein UH239_08900 [Acutalibacteraceae bacterium]|nr:hypothetical protein [Acutalibacteraceae bacterium]